MTPVIREGHMTHLTEWRRLVLKWTHAAIFKGLHSYYEMDLPNEVTIAILKIQGLAAISRDKNILRGAGNTSKLYIKETFEQTNPQYFLPISQSCLFQKIYISNHLVYFFTLFIILVVYLIY